MTAYLSYHKIRSFTLLQPDSSPAPIERQNPAFAHRSCVIIASASATQTTGGAIPIEYCPYFSRTVIWLWVTVQRNYQFLKSVIRQREFQVIHLLKEQKKIRNLWRIDPISQKARQNLLVSGIALRSQHIDLTDANPYIHGNDRQTTKVIISDIPLSVANHDIKPIFMKKGYKPVSDNDQVRMRSWHRRKTYAF